MGARASARTFFRVPDSLSVISIPPQVMTHLPSPFESMSTFLRSAEIQEHQATLAAVSLTGHLLHAIAAANVDGALLSMRIMPLATWAAFSECEASKSGSPEAARKLSVQSPA